MSEETTTTAVEPNPTPQVSPSGGPTPDEAQAIVQALMDLGMTPQEISDGIEGRVSMRTIYRWGKGESVPQNQTNLQALVDLAATKGVG